jgi:histidinol-phosphate/aromatic aminotransferase/cobyric acid decarboxylase-like protein
MHTLCRSSCPCGAPGRPARIIEADCNSIGRRAAYTVPAVRLALETDPVDVLSYERPNKRHDGWSDRLRRKLAEYEGVPEDLIYITGSGLEFISAAVSALEIGTLFCLEGDFIGYSRAASLARAEKRTIPCDPLTKSFPPERIADHVRGAKNAMLALTFPFTNPLQTPVSEEAVEAAAKANPDLIILADGAYLRFGKRHGLAKLALLYPNLFYLQVAAKDLFLSGARLSWIVTSRALASRIAAILPPYPVNPVSVQQAYQMLCAPGIVEKLRQTQSRARDILAVGLDAIGLDVIAGPAPWILVRFGRDARDIVSELAKRGILIQLQDENSCLKGWVRISATVPCEAGAIVDALSSLKVAGGRAS